MEVGRQNKSKSQRDTHPKNEKQMGQLLQPGTPNLRC